MSLILRFTIDKIILPDQQDTSSNPTASTTTLDISGLRFDRENWRIMDHWKDLTFIRAHLIHTSGDSRLRP